MKKAKTTKSHLKVLNIFSSKKKMDSLYGHMFLEDFVSFFSFTFSKPDMYRDFFNINSSNNTLIRLLDNDKQDFLEYKFSELLSHNLHELIIHGKCYVEVKLQYDHNNLCGIDFKPIHYIFILKGLYNILFFLKDSYGMIIKKVLPKTLLLQFDLAEIGYSHSCFNKIVNNLATLDLPDFEKMQKYSLSFDQYKLNQEFDLLRITRDVPWNGRSNDNEYLNDIYFIYRLIKFNNVKRKFLDYFLRGYNNMLTQLGKVHGFDGEIIYTVIINNHENEYEKLLNGEISIAQMCEYLRAQ